MDTMKKPKCVLIKIYEYVNGKITLTHNSFSVSLVQKDHSIKDQGSIPINLDF